MQHFFNHLTLSHLYWIFSSKWWILTTCKIGFGGGLSATSAVATAVTAKINKNHKKSYDTSILGFSMMLISKMRSVFVLGYHQKPTRAPLGGIRGARGVKTNTPLKIMWYINSRVFNSWDFKNEISFPHRIPLEPPRTLLEEAGGWNLYTTQDNVIYKFWGL